MREVTITPSIWPSMRTQTSMPSAAQNRAVDWGKAAAFRTQALVQRPPRSGWSGMFHPVLHAIAPPGCSAHFLRLPVGVVAQVSVDAVVGAIAIGLAALHLIVGETELACAYLQNHGLHVVMACNIMLFSFCAGATAGALMWLLRG